MAIKLHEGTGRILPGQALMAAGGIISALAASSCCVLPLVLFSLGISGAWIGHFTRLAPYQPYFIMATIGFLACGIWLMDRSRRVACADGAACARPLPGLFVKAGLIAAAVLILAALGLDVVAPLLFDT